MNSAYPQDLETKLVVKSANAILKCATLRTVQHYSGQWNYTFHEAFEECNKEYSEYMTKNLKNLGSKK